MSPACHLALLGLTLPSEDLGILIHITVIFTTIKLIKFKMLAAAA